MIRSLCRPSWRGVVMKRPRIGIIPRIGIEARLLPFDSVLMPATTAVTPSWMRAVVLSDRWVKEGVRLVASDPDETISDVSNFISIST